MPYFMGIDISTTSAKAIIIDDSGGVQALGSAPQSTSQPKPLWSQQDPADWWSGVQSAIRKALNEADLSGEAIAGVGLTGQMHGLVMLDGAGNVLRPAILWNDQRTQAQCDWMTEKIGFDRLLELTGNRALTGFTAPKLLWVRDNEPDVYRHCAQVLLPKDYIRYKLTGEFGTDLAGASGTLLLDVARRNWSHEVLDALGIQRAWLPDVHEGTVVTGLITRTAADATNLSPGTPVVAGGGDQAAGAVGMGAVTPATVGVTIGTSGVVFAPLDEYAYEPQGLLHAFCHAVPNTWHVMGVMLSAAGSLSWYREALAPDISYDDLLSEAATVPAGSEGLYFLPYLSGERTPHPDPDARGAFIGLTTRHTRAHMTRAVLEGVAYGLNDIFTLIAQTGLPNDVKVRISGGGARSPFWQQIIADVLKIPLVNVQAPEAGAFGAATLAAVGVGAFASVHDATGELVQMGEVVHPRADTSVYAEFYPTYNSLYPALKGVRYS